MVSVKFIPFILHYKMTTYNLTCLCNTMNSTYPRKFYTAEPYMDPNVSHMQHELKISNIYRKENTDIQNQCEKQSLTPWIFQSIGNSQYLHQLPHFSFILQCLLSSFGPYVMVDAATCLL